MQGRMHSHPLVGVLTTLLGGAEKRLNNFSQCEIVGFVLHGNPFLDLVRDCVVVLCHRRLVLSVKKAKNERLFSGRVVHAAGALLVTVGGHYSLRMQLSSSVVSEGDSVSVTCEIHNKLNTSPTFVFVKKITTDGDDVKIASNRVVEELFQRTGRYRIELRRNDTQRLRHVWYTLRIASMSRSELIF